MIDTIVVVASGGHAIRLAGRQPKSLMPYGRTAFLAIVLKTIKPWPFPVVIATNRQEYLQDYRCLSSHHSHTTIALDDGVPSTIDLARRAALTINCSRVLFLYGHAPRPSSHIAAMLGQRSALVLSSCSSTSKRQPIQCGSDRFIEPPYLVSRELLISTSAPSWNDFIATHRIHASVVALDGPCEFNEPVEVPPYERYIQRWNARRASCRG